MALKILSSKKSIFFTLTALVLLILLLFSTGLIQKYEKREKSFILETRIISMDYFINSVDEDMERGVYISGYRALLALEDYITINGRYVNNAKTRFKEAFLNGTINNSEANMMINNTFLNWTEKMKTEALKTDIIVNFTINDVRLYQIDPWNVLIDLNVSLDVSDKKQTASWKKEKIVTSEISILGFEDPIYTIETGNNLLVSINTTPYENNYTNGTDVTNLLDHMHKSYYSAFTGAPSFLMRFEGNFSKDPNGIESIVDKNELGLYVPVFKPRSSIDYLYWGHPSVRGEKIQGMPTDFVMDNETNAELNQTHLQKYQLSGLII